MSGLFNKTGYHPVGLNGVLIAGEHVEVLEGNATVLAGDGFDFRFKVRETVNEGDMGQGFCAKLGENFGKAVDGFGFQDAVAGGGALTVLVNFPRHGVCAVRFVEQEEVGDGELFGRGKVAGGGDACKVTEAGDGVFDSRILDANRKDGIYDTEGEMSIAVVGFRREVGKVEVGFAVFGEAGGRS